MVERYIHAVSSSGLIEVSIACKAFSNTFSREIQETRVLPSTATPTPPFEGLHDSAHALYAARECAYIAKVWVLVFGNWGFFRMSGIRKLMALTAV